MPPRFTARPDERRARIERAAAFGQAERAAAALELDLPAFRPPRVFDIDKPSNNNATSLSWSANKSKNPANMRVHRQNSLAAL